MSILTTAKTNIPSKVHFTEYIVTESGPKESRHFHTLKHPNQADAAVIHMIFQRPILFMKMARFYVFKDKGPKVVIKKHAQARKY